MDQETFDTLVTRLLAGEASDAEAAILESEVNASEASRSRFEESCRLWHSMAPQEGIPSFEKFWKAVDPKVENNIRRTRDSVRTHGSLRTWGNYPRQFAFAALLLLALGIAHFSSDSSWFNSYRLESTKPGEQCRIELNDGSIIRLNADSKVRVPKNFGENSRKIQLEGQGFFEVQPSSIPFEVETESSRVTVLGTKFDVRARGESTRVVVKSGRVLFANITSQAEDGVLLLADQMSEMVATQTPTTPEKVNAVQLLGWLSGRLVFVKTPLLEVVAELSRTFGVTVLVSDSEAASRTLTADFDGETIDEILDAVSLTLNLNLKHEKGVYTFVP